MKRETPFRLTLLGALAFFALACGQPVTEPPEDAGEQQDETDAGSLPEDAGTDAGEQPPPPGPELTTQESYGGFVTAPSRAFLPGSTVTLLGLHGMVQDPSNLGRDPQDGTYAGWLMPGLLEVNTTSGKVRHYTSADGLPLMEYVDPFTNYGLHTATIFDLAWITPDQQFVGAAYDFIVKGTLDATSQEWKFTANRVKAPGQTEWAKTAHVVVAGGEIYVGSDQGVAVLDPTTLLPKRWVALGVSLSGPWVSGLSAGKVDGKESVGIVFGPADAAPSHVALVEAGETNATLFLFADGSVPLSVYGMDGMMLVGAEQTDGRGAIYAIGPTFSGLAMDVMVSADNLAASSEGPVRPGEMAWDASRSKLIVGGHLTPSGGGGLVELEGSSDGNIWGVAQDLVAVDDPYRQLLPWSVDELAFDNSGRLYISGRQLCSEHKMRQLPIVRLERDGEGNPRLVRPYVSGVRDIEQDPVNGDTWLAMRDGMSGMQCDGINIGQSLCRLRADGACEIVPVSTTDGSLILTAPGVVDLAFGKAEKKELALATVDEATWVRRNDTKRQLMTQIDPKLSLDLTSVAFGEEGELWLGSQSDFQTYPDLDEMAIYKRSPHGLGFLELLDDASPAFTRRYVRAKSDLNDVEEIAGLPSDTVWAVLPLPGPRTALVATGVERLLSVYDHVQGLPSPTNAAGGLALIQDTQVNVLAPPSGKAFTDVVGLARGKDGAIFAVDAELGVLAVDVEGLSTTVWAKAAWSSPERPLSMAADSTGRIAVGTTRAVYVYGADTGVTQTLANGERGYAWRVKFISDGALLVGTDQGLTRVAIQGATLPATLGPASYTDRELWPIAPPCGGVDGCVCKVIEDCAKGYDCLCDKNNNCACAAQDPCVADPGGLDCSCQMGSMTCNKGLACECFGPDCYCKIDPATCANGACSCTDHFECPTNWYCNQTANSCAERQLCDEDCSCATSSGCSPGLVCQGGIAGFSCI